MVWIYKFANFNKAKNLILSTNWDMFISDNADLSVENWQNHFLAIMNLCIPRKPLFKKTRPPWLSRYILKLIRKRNHCFCRAKRTNQSSDQVRYRQLRNKIVSMIRLAKKHYYGSIDISDQKKFWKAYGVVNKKVCSIPTLSYGSSEAHSDKQKADVLNSFFSVPPLASSDKIILSDIWLPSEHYCTEEEILVLLRNLDCTKSTGPDGISARMLKETALSISGPLTNLLNFLIRQQHFPYAWKFANVVPIPKDQSCKSSPSGYRPISL